MGAKFKYFKLGEDTGWYQVKDATGRECATFSLIDVPAPTPQYCKHMEIRISSGVLEECIENGNSALLFGIYRFVFRTVLSITHELKGVRLCKIYCADERISLVYGKFAHELSEKFSYKTKFYGRWIEIEKSGN